MHKYYDVNDLSELPQLSEQFRYFDFIGGTKELRCFVVSRDLARNKFMEQNKELVEECLRPLYENKGIVVKQDASFALPGCYIVSLLKHYRSLDEIDELTFIRAQLILREIRKGMRERLGIHYTHIYYEERNVLSHNVHYWIVPIDIENYPRLYNMDIKKYLDQFLFSQNREKIIQNNALLQTYIYDVNLLKRDNDLESLLNKHTPPNMSPLTVDFNVNGMCNLRCSWCWGPDHQAKEELTHQQWKQLARRLQILGTRNITITGGEPLMKEGLGDILKYLHDDLGIRVTLSTNGILLKSQAINILPYVDDIGLPIDGHSKEINHLMRAGTPRHFDKVLESMKLVQTDFPGIDLTIRTIISKKNVESVPFIGKTLIEYGIDPKRLRWKLYQVTPMGLRKEDVLNGDWILSDEEFKKAADRVMDQNLQFQNFAVLKVDMHVDRYFHIYPDGESHVFITGKDGNPTPFGLGNIGKNFDAVIQKLNQFNLAKNFVR